MKDTYRDFDTNLTNRLTFEDMPAGDAPAEGGGGDAPAEPAKCPKCGGEMTEGHTCPMPAGDAPATPEGGQAEGEGEKHPAASADPAASDAPAEPEKKPGFFAKLFGKK